MINFLLNRNYGLEIKIFSTIHLFLVILIILISLLIMLDNEKLKNLSNAKKKKLRLIMGIILMLNLFINYGSLIMFKAFDYQKHLYLGFCNFTSIVFLIYCLTGNKKIYSFCYYMVFTGPLMSILLPSGNLSLNNYSFYSFFVLHHLVFVFNLVFMYCENYHYKKNDFIKYLIFITIYSLLVFVINEIFETNYNNPYLFINDNLDKYFMIKIVTYNNYIAYFTFYSFILGLPFLGKFFLKRLNN